MQKMIIKMIHGIGIKRAGYLLAILILGVVLITCNQSDKTPDEINKVETPLSNKKYICPMHSHIVSSEKGACPICGMDLVINKSAITPLSNTQRRTQEYPAVHISPGVKHNLGIRTEIVKYTDLTHNIETIGKITRVDPMARSRVTSPINGTLQKITDKYTNDKVQLGEFLFSVVSDDLFKAEQTFQQKFIKGDKALAASMIPDLVKMGLDTEQIAQLQQGVTPTLPAKIYAKEDGIIFTRRGEAGDPVTTAFTVFNLGGNYQVIEVTVEIFERQWGLVKEGQSARMQLRNIPDKIFTGKVERVDEPVGYTTRALETRIKFKTDYEGLTQSTFARVIINGKTKHHVVTVPKDAVIRTAQGNRVIRITEGDQFQPVDVKIGDESNGKIEIISGIKAGDKIVVSGQFLIDSESNLRAGLQRMSTDNKQEAQLSMDGSADSKNHRESR